VVLAPQQFAAVEDPSRAGHGDGLQDHRHAEHAVAVTPVSLRLDDDVEVRDGRRM
jgi:hypothetical protein